MEELKALRTAGLCGGLLVLVGVLGLSASASAHRLTVKPALAAPAPTTTSTSLSGADESGEEITVSEGTAVSDSATISGANAATATGTVTYKVYSDSACTSEVASAGEVSVSGGSVPPSNSETLAAGTYYWQASYGGDAENEGSTSTCGAEVETVQTAPPPPSCSTVVGSATVLIRKENETERQKVTNRLSTEPAPRQKLVFTWESGASKITLTELTSASCVVKENGTKKFRGTGQATVNGEAGWGVKFFFTLTAKGKFVFHIRASKREEAPLGFTDRAAMLTSEKIS